MREAVEKLSTHTLECAHCREDPDQLCAVGAQLIAAVVSLTGGSLDVPMQSSAVAQDIGTSETGGDEPANYRSAPGEPPRKPLPKTNRTLVLRSDFSDEKAWESICDAIRNPNGEFKADVEFISDPIYTDVSVEQLVSLQPRVSLQLLYPIPHTFLFLVDSVAITQPEHPILAVDLSAESGRTFRVIPSALAIVENNLSIANMDFAEFADTVDPDGTYRGPSA